MLPDFVQAGKVLDNYIRRRWHDSSQWLRSLPSPPCSPATMRAICNGSFNSNMGATLSMLWRVCYELAGRDENSAQTLMLLYFQEAGVVPPSNLAAIHVELARCQVDMRRVSHALERLARKHEREAMASEAEVAPEPQGYGDGQSTPNPAEYSQ